MLLTAGSTLSVQPFVFAGKLPYDPLDGIARVGTVPHLPLIVTAPAKTPAEVVQRGNAKLRKYLASPEASEAFLKIGHDASPSTPEAVRALIQHEQKAYSALVKQIGPQPE